MIAAILLIFVCIMLALWLVFDQAIKSSCDHEFELKGLSHMHNGDVIEHYECKKCGRGVFKREFY